MPATPRTQRGRDRIGDSKSTSSPAQGNQDDNQHQDDDAFLRLSYEESRNAVYVWEALHEALTATEESTNSAGRLVIRPVEDPRTHIPDWVVDYLRRVSARFGEMSRYRVPRKGEIESAILEALEFRRPGRTSLNPFRHISDRAHDVRIGIDVLFALRRDNAGPDAAIYSVVEAHPKKCERCKTISYSTVYRNWVTYGKPLL